MKNFIVLGFLLLFNIYISAHPHMFLDSQIGFEFSETELKGFWVTWYFDEMFSEGILMDYDYNNDYKFDQEESLSVEMGAFANLENYNYFLFVYKDGIENRINRVENFKVEYSNGRIVYKFFVPYKLYISEKKEQLKLSIYDETFFCDIGYIKKSPVRFIKSEALNTSYIIEKNTNKAISYSNASTVGGRSGINYSGQVHPDEIILEVSKK